MQSSSHNLFLLASQNVIQKIRLILPKALAIGSTIYSCTFFFFFFFFFFFSRKSIVMSPFISQKTVSINFTECFLYQRVGMFPLYGLFFQLELIVVNLCLAHLCFFSLKYAFLYTSPIPLQISHDLHFPATKNLMTGLSSNLEHSDLLPF